MTADRARRILEQAGFTVTVVQGFGRAVEPPGEDRWRVERGYKGTSSGLTDEHLCAMAEKHLPDTEQLTLGDS